VTQVPASVLGPELRKALDHKEATQALRALRQRRSPRQLVQAGREANMRNASDVLTRGKAAVPRKLPRHQLNAVMRQFSGL